MSYAHRDLPRRLSAVGMARHWATEHCADALSEQGQAVLELLTSEVVANAVLHGREPLTLTVQCEPGEVTVEVTDASPDLPVLKQVAAEATGGRGVALVDALAQRWGAERRGQGKRTWFTVQEGP
ncbi:ATP-binding protein [Kineococcus endophyticus]|uniref:ATP-binding protein n=1 Tax=Kineococcus endophyticus TaxID=1181883 RepID=A0ABV3P4J5_9ACTN